MLKALSRGRDGVLLLLAILCVVGPITKSEADHPNIVLIVSDDQGIDAIQGPSWPNELNCRTPILASLAGQGRVFRGARVNPNCSPTRAGLYTGRYAFRNGVAQVIPSGGTTPDRALQWYERTIAEMLQTQGYYNVFVDKWHLGRPEAGMGPLDQGYHVSLPTSDYMALDDPLEVGDEHIRHMVDLAVGAVEDRPDPDAPYFLTFATIDPHRRTDTSGNESRPWWKVDEDLLPSGENYYADDTDTNRFRAVVEAMDTEVGRLLKDLRIVDRDFQYRSQSDTIVFFIGDNGTDPLVAHHAGRSKGWLYEPGIQVPFFVFGEDVPDDGLVLDRLVEHVDLYETIGDIVGASASERGQPARDSVSFADSIGWGPGDPERIYSMSSRGGSLTDRNRASLTDGRYKLIVFVSQGDEVALELDEFYDLSLDPGEANDLVANGMDAAEEAAYLALRDAFVDYRPDAVGEATELHVDVPWMQARSISSENVQYQSGLPVGHYRPGTSAAIEVRALIRFNMSEVEDLLPDGRTIDDIVGAQIVLRFGSDSHLPLEDTRSGTYSCYPMRYDWWRDRARWREVEDGHDPDVLLGRLEVPPHIASTRVSANAGEGMFIPTGSPLSMGHSDSLLSEVLDWIDDPPTNEGVVIIGNPLPLVGGDQHTNLQRDAVLRLTLRSEGN